VFSSIPLGCIRLKAIDLLLPKLYDLLKSEDLNSDVKDEISFTFNCITPLNKPLPIKIEGKN
jgi:hypothetical protein